MDKETLDTLKKIKNKDVRITLFNYIYLLENQIKTLTSERDIILSKYKGNKSDQIINDIKDRAIFLYMQQEKDINNCIKQAIKELVHDSYLFETAIMFDTTVQEIEENLEKQVLDLLKRSKNWTKKW